MEESLSSPPLGDSEIAPSAPVRRDGASPLSKSMNRLSLQLSNSEHAPRSPKSSSFSTDQKSSVSTASTSRPTSRRSSIIPPNSPKFPRRTAGISSYSRDGSTSPGRPSPRRSASGTHFSAASMNSGAPLPSPIKEKSALTAPSLAALYLSKDLVQHEVSDPSELVPEAVVLIHDACYGHRYSRPKTTKSTLSSIVERPERIQAGVLGLSCAYVRLGGRHAGGVSAPSPNTEPDAQIPFQIRKTKRSVPLTSSAVTNVHGTKWMKELKTMCDAAETRLATGGKELTRPDDSSGIPGQQNKPRLHEGDLYLCKESLDALQGALGGVFDAVDAIFQDTVEVKSPKRAFVCVRPPGHHCSSDYPSGFCWINNVHVGIEHAAQAYGLTHAAIIDFDLHHGDGSQAISWQRNSRTVKPTKAMPAPKKAVTGYFSLHDINSYPCEYGDTEKVQSASLCIENAHGQTIWNVHLQPWKTEAEFWKLYQSRYVVLLEKTRTFLRSQTVRVSTSPGSLPPKGAIFISAGFDASEWEGAGMQRHKVNVPTSFYAQFTADVIKLAEEEGTSVEGRVISVLEGGYSERALTSGVLSHITGLVEKKLHQVDPGTSVVGNDSSNHDHNLDNYEEWWSEAALKELEELSKLRLAPPVSKSTKYMEPPTYTSPTQSFTAKVVDPSKLIRSISGTLQSASAPPLRPSTPPPPDVEWATAANELSKLLIPSDLPVRSYKHEELSEPKVKKERHSSIGLPGVEAVGGRMQLRGRKSKLPNHAEEELGDAVPAVRRPSNSGRRQTMPEVSLLLDGNAAPPANSFTESTVQLRRRSSTASTAQSINGINAGSAADSRSASATPSTDSAGIKVKRTRRASGVKLEAVNSQNSAAPPPMPAMPQQFTTAPNSGTNPRTAQVHSLPAQQEGTPESGVDEMNKGFKRLILKMPTKENGEPTESSQAKPIRKAAAARGAKTAARKPAAKTAKKTPTQTPVKEEVKSPLDQDAANQKVEEKAVEISSTTAGREPAGPNMLHETVVDAPNYQTAGQTAEMPNESDPLLQSSTGQVTQQEIPADSAAAASSAAHTSADQTSLGKPSTYSYEQDNHYRASNSTTPAISNLLNPTPPSSSDPQGTSTSTTTAPSNPSPNFIPYEPPDVLATLASSTRPQEPLTWLPPNTSTPAALKRGKESLPVFSANGYIPFALKPGTTGAENALPERPVKLDGDIAGDLKEENDNARASVWDVPDTPGR